MCQLYYEAIVSEPSNIKRVENCMGATYPCGPYYPPGWVKRPCIPEFQRVIRPAVWGNKAHIAAFQKVSLRPIIIIPSVNPATNKGVHGYSVPVLRRR
jgi:hypothetical protein